MITKQEFDIAAKNAISDFGIAFPKMVSYKSYIQRAVLDIASLSELNDVRDCRINQSLIDKLARLAKQEWLLSRDALSLYCAAMAVGTIIKEYDWGTQYIVGDGIWEIAKRIQNA